MVVVLVKNVCGLLLYLAKQMMVVTLVVDMDDVCCSAGTCGEWCWL